MKDRATRLEKIYKTIKVELIESTVKNMVISDEKKYIKYAPSYQRNYI